MAERPLMRPNVVANIAAGSAKKHSALFRPIAGGAAGYFAGVGNSNFKHRILVLLSAPFLP
jgi:hypothetical protein